jgi:hypothetical protein
VPSRFGFLRASIFSNSLNLQHSQLLMQRVMIGTLMWGFRSADTGRHLRRRIRRRTYPLAQHVQDQNRLNIVIYEKDYLAARFTPLRETRRISSYGQSQLEWYQSDLAYRMSVLPRRVGGRIFQLPIEGTGREWPPGKGVKRHLCRR